MVNCPQVLFLHCCYHIATEFWVGLPHQMPWLLFVLLLIFVLFKGSIYLRVVFLSAASPWVPPSWLATYVVLSLVPPFPSLSFFLPPLPLSLPVVTYY